MATSDPNPILTCRQAADDWAQAVQAVQGQVTPEETRRCHLALARLARSHEALRAVLVEVVDALAMAVEWPPYDDDAGVEAHPRYEAWAGAVDQGLEQDFHEWLAALVRVRARQAMDTEQGTAPNPVPRPVERSPAPPTQ